RIDEELRNGTSNSSYGGGDARLFTKARLFAAAGPWPAVALRFGTKLPNAKLADRLGTDETDFQIETLFSRDFGRVAAHLNLGIAILGNGGPTVAGDTSFNNTGQDDPFLWSFSLAGEAHPAPFGDGWTWRPLGELRGMAASRF